MQPHDSPTVQFSPGGEQWWQIPIGAAVYASDGMPVGAIAAVGTAYLHTADVMPGDGGLFIPLQAITMYDPAANVVHLSVGSDAVQTMAGTPPANDPASLQALHGTLPLPVARPPAPPHARVFALREQHLVVTTLPNVVKEVTVRRERTTGLVTVTESIRKESAHVETQRGPDDR